MIALGEHCRKLRTKAGYSVNRMTKEGEQLSPDVINRLESGSGAVTVLSIARYADILGLHPKKLLDFSFDFNE
ncbi:MAG: helix-turn-helix domain-containing protein [Bdellovibrionales bacterium]|nr:helix-turn-helix domain-containing protein [Bdellovibrionales bacterium]